MTRNAPHPAVTDRPVPAGLDLEPYDPRTAPDSLIEALTVFENIQLHERQPDNPPLAPSQVAASLRHLPAFVEVPAWVVRDGERVIADATVALVRLDQNRHMAQVKLGVLATYRRQGIGRALLEKVVDAAHADGRTMLMVSSNSRVPAGETALRQTGAKPGLAAQVNQLDVHELDPSLLQRWITQGQERAAGYNIEVWEGAVPEEDVTAFLELTQVMNDQPLGELEVEDTRLTVEQFLAAEAHFHASGRQRVLGVARRTSDAGLVGFTELSWHPGRPSILAQGATGVVHQARGLGLGRWLKAVALQRALALNGDARFVRTENADANAAMRLINEELGFRPYSATTLWQLEVSQAQAYLQGMVNITV
ncbi:GNAT family N-acetyltransferase [Deinococcus malanensis]|uniref:GNAT family N-acetyltransferase n=1 Tax=Deinococcus malanensis TaxID=1706855 RepID=A0ABQ2F254_9DEIO|nr:GNAT family N-acetyltransferase [Deinococcus malanensis]GGK42451.1 GNAT family N-acetyltransferase [Deinococcus malanensis]